MITYREKLEGSLALEEANEAIVEYFSQYDTSGKKLLLIIPDLTRSGPIGEAFQMVYDQIGSKASQVDILVALGTHMYITEEQICQRLCITMEERKTKYASVGFYNHEWDKPETFRNVGLISAQRIEEISDGLFSEEVPVDINKMIFDYDEFLILGPVFPHEVVGFSGGHKYLFPGIAGERIINFFHWLGAVVTNIDINGQKHTKTRAVVEEAAGFIDLPGNFVAVVACEGNFKGIYVGDVMEAWEKAADMSDQVHIIYKEKPYKTVLGLAPEMYDDIWTAGKVMYKLEPVLAEGATLIIYAPHIDEISYTHGKVLDEVGYHTRDYFLKQWDAFKHHPRGVLAHSTHVKGIGTYEDGVEKPRANVILATKISKERCDRVNLGYMDYKSIDIDAYRNREDEGILVVDHAGEILHRLSS